MRRKLDSWSLLFFARARTNNDHLLTSCRFRQKLRTGRLRIVFLCRLLNPREGRISRIPLLAGARPDQNTVSWRLNLSKVSESDESGKVSECDKTTRITTFSHFSSLSATFTHLSRFPRRLTGSSGRNLTFILGYSCSGQGARSRGIGLFTPPSGNLGMTLFSGRNPARFRPAPNPGPGSPETSTFVTF